MCPGLDHTIITSLQEKRDGEYESCSEGYILPKYLFFYIIIIITIIIVIKIILIESWRWAQHYPSVLQQTNIGAGTSWSKFICLFCIALYHCIVLLLLYHH